MIKWSGIALIALSIVHMIVLGIDAATEVPGWLGLKLWTLEHWQSVVAQPHDLVVSGAAFWSTIGSFAIPVIILGCLVVWLDRQGREIPPFVGWSIAIWITVASLVIEPSGFPLGVVAAICLMIGIRKRRQRAAA